MVASLFKSNLLSVGIENPHPDIITYERIPPIFGMALNSDFLFRGNPDDQPDISYFVFW